MGNLIAQLLLRMPTVAGIFLAAAGIFCSTVGWSWYLVFGRGLVVPVPLFGLFLLLAGAFALVVGLRGFLRTEPVHQLQRGRLEARPPSWRRAWILYFADFQLTVDKRSGYAFVDRTSFWFFRNTEAIPLKHIERIEFKHDRLSRWDTFSIALVVKGRDAPLPLFLFKGHEEDDRHDDAARALVEDLKRVTGVGLGMAPATDDGGGWRCTSCGRAGGPSRATCLYCGAPTGTGAPAS